jgi:hypothetical protein
VHEAGLQSYVGSSVACRGLIVFGAFERAVFGYVSISWRFTVKTLSIHAYKLHLKIILCLHKNKIQWCIVNLSLSQAIWQYLLQKNGLNLSNLYSYW